MLHASGSSSGDADDFEDLCAPTLGRGIAPGHQLGLPETGVDRCGRGAVVVAQHRDRLGELADALLQPSGGPQVTTEPFVAPRRTERRRPVVEGSTRQLHGSFVADGGGCDVGRLPQAVSLGWLLRRSRPPHPTTRRPVRDGRTRPLGRPSRRHRRRRATRRRRPRCRPRGRGERRAHRPGPLVAMRRRAAGPVLRRCCGGGGSVAAGAGRRRRPRRAAGAGTGRRHC